MSSVPWYIIQFRLSLNALPDTLRPPIVKSQIPWIPTWQSDPSSLHAPWTAFRMRLMTVRCAPSSARHSGRCSKDNSSENIQQPGPATIDAPPLIRRKIATPSLAQAS